MDPQRAFVNAAPNLRVIQERCAVVIFLLATHVAAVVLAALALVAFSASRMEQQMRSAVGAYAVTISDDLGQQLGAGRIVITTIEPIFGYRQDFPYVEVHADEHAMLGSATVTMTDHMLALLPHSVFGMNPEHVNHLKILEFDDDGFIDIGQRYNSEYQIDIHARIGQWGSGCVTSMGWHTYRLLGQVHFRKE